MSSNASSAHVFPYGEGGRGRHSLGTSTPSSSSPTATDTTEGEDANSGGVSSPLFVREEDDNQGENGEDTDTASEHDLVILSIYWRNGKLGAAVYSLDNPVIYVLNDFADDFTLGFRALRSLFLQVQPSHVITCKKMQQPFIELVNCLLSGEEESLDQILHGNLHLLPDVEFRNENCLNKIYGLKLPGEPEDWPEEEHRKYIRSLLDTSQDSMINALARLVTYLHSNLTLLALSHQQNTVLGFRNLCLDNQVWVNNQTFRALQIFTHIAHPSLFKWTSGEHKEGLSIYGLFNRCHSKIGSKFLRAVLLRPTSNIEELNKRHEVIAFCIDIANDNVVKKMRGCIKEVQSISGILPRLSAAQATITQWKSLKKTISNVLLIREICYHFAHVSVFEKARSIISEDLYRVSELMGKVIDFQTSEEMKRFVVLPGVDSTLDKLKHTYANLNTLMAELTPQELQDLPEHIPECTMIFLPEIGFLISVPMWKETLTQEEMNIPGFKFKFIANKMIHYKSLRCRELDSSLGDVYLRIGEYESKIMRSLVQFVQEHILSLLDSLNYVRELDCLLALAEVARDNGYVKPTITTGREILIEKGRHPLQECCVTNFVPNDFCSSNTQDLVKILTGPNASGKSVYLKQVAIIAYLAHTGSYVPAKSVVIGVLDQIHTRIQTTESATSQLSAFLIDLKQMNTAICMSTKSSLIVVDEFGKGTLEDDGLALLTAFLSSLLERGAADCPHVILSTHFHRLIDLMDRSPLVQTYILEHLVSDGELVYLYQLEQGQIKKSLAIEVAKANGIADSQIKRAREVLNAKHLKPIHKKMSLSKEDEAFMREFLTMTFDTDKEVEDFTKRLSELK